MDFFYKVDYSNKSYFFYTLDDCMISNIIKKNKIWEPHLHYIFDKFIKNDSVVIECGCHIGTHTLKMATLCKKIYCFEPMPTTHEILNKNIVLNNITNAIVFKKGVADKIGITKYGWIPDHNPGASGLDNNPMGKPPMTNAANKIIEVELTTIDSLELDKVDFMKIDVEGYETLVIQGAMNTIKKYKPIICMEVWKNHFGEFDLQHTKELFKNLLEIGYDVEHIYGPDFLFIPK